MHVLLCFDRKFLLGAAVTIRSITENACPDRPLHFHIVHPDLREGDLRSLSESAAPRVGPVTVDAYDLDAGPLRGLLRSKNVSHTAYARLLAADVLGQSIERVVYVDVDVLFLRDVCELDDLSLDGYVLAAVPNGPVEDQKRQLRRIGSSADAYFASGLMVIDLNRWREENVGDRALVFARELGGRLVLHDQDALNAALEGRFLVLSHQWCHIPWAHGSAGEADVVVHYAMSPKPWHPDYDGEYGEEFLSYLARTAFGDWRPSRWMGLAPLTHSLLRRLPYLPTVMRMLRERMTGLR